jgi:hypothetical protein
MNVRTILAVAGLACSISGTAWAGTADPGVNARQANQRERIQQGVASGEITRREQHRLNATQRAIAVEERAFKSDGRLTAAERRKLHRDLDRASRDIHRQKHDGQSRH